MDQLTHVSTFKLPKLKSYNWAQFTFNYAKGPIAYRPVTNTLLIRGHGSYKEVAEVNIPDNGDTATLLGDWFDITGGLLDQRIQQLGRQVYLYGLFIDEEDIVFGGIAEYYNVTNANDPPFFYTDYRFKQSKGFWLGDIATELQLSRWVTRLSPELSKYYGVRYAGGCTTAQGVSGSSYGPNMYVFNLPDQNLPTGAMSVKKIIGYTRLDPWVVNNETYWPSWECNTGISLPNSMIWVGRRGYGDPDDLKLMRDQKQSTAAWYGEASETFTNGATTTTLKDVGSPYRGYHSLHYTPSIWQISNTDLMAGNLNYSAIDLSGVMHEPGAHLSATYDWQGKRLFILEERAMDGVMPLIHVYSVQ